MQGPFLTPSHITFSPATPSPSLWSTLKGAAHALVGALTLSSELQVTQVVINGCLTWYAFDPKTGRKFFADTEEEMRLWIEDTYHNG